MKQLAVQADDASAEATKLEAQEAPERELVRLKREADDLETARQKAVKAFRP
jgi:hypothetical protein